MARKKVEPPSTEAGDLLLLQAARLWRLFVSNTRSSGRYDPRKDKAWTEFEPLKQSDWEAHLSGQYGVGAVPIQDDDTCQWAALDLDNHDTDEDLPLAEVVEKIETAKLPLIACRSKSGGIHCYLFLEKPQPCAKVRIFLNGWASLLGYGGSEIFPKQAKLTYMKDNPTQKIFGNWLNFPYFKGDETNRYAFSQGKKLSLSEFLDLAERSKVTDHQLKQMASVEHPDAPPCVQKMFANGVAQGHRNEALYNITVYYRKSNPEGFEAKAIAANQSVFNKPLPRGELQRTIGSAGRSNCAYRCNEEPIRSLCDRETCVTRKFGISGGDLERLDTVDALPTFSDLTKYLTEPVRWEFRIDGVKMGNVSTAQLLDWRAMREMIADRLTRIVPMIKGQEWERILHPLMSAARIVDAPDDASISGVIRSRLREFCAKADIMSHGQDPAERKVLLRGLPVVQLHQAERFVFFRGQDFVDFLKRTKSEELKGVALWMAIKDLGVENIRMRIPGARRGEDNINVWGLPVKEALSTLEHEADPPKFKEEM